MRTDEESGIFRTFAKNISPYLVEGADRALLPVKNPPRDVPRMSWGNKPTDGGHLILTPDERDELLRREPGASRFVRRYMSGGDFLKGKVRYCLWLVDADPSELRHLPLVAKRVDAVRRFRERSRAESTRRYSQFPTLFRQIAQPSSDYLVIPEVSSERRQYIPMAFVSNEIICSNTVQFVPESTLYHFGVLTSEMHMAWARLVCGRLESRLRYSNPLVYNNYPWPLQPSNTQRGSVERAAQAVLDARAAFPESTLATLYDPLLMPPSLVRAHKQLDRSVELCYRPEPFPNDRARVEFLFAMYEQKNAPLLPTARSVRRAGNRAIV